MGLTRALPALLALLQSAALAGQETVRSASVQAELGDAGSGARVRVEYTVVGSEPGRAIPATLLAFGSAEAGELRLGSAGRPADFAMGPGRARTVLLTVEPGGEGEARVVAEYTVRQPVAAEDGAMRGFIPILSLDRPPEQARPGLFRGEMTLPEGWRVSEAFPAGLRRAGPPLDGAQRWSVALPVVPATLSFRAHPDGGWHPGLPFVLDALAVLIVLGFSLVGWRHLREEAS